MTLEPSEASPSAGRRSQTDAAPCAPVYYWAGAGSAIVHRLKGFTFAIDQQAYERAYNPDRLRWLRDIAGAGFLFLSYNWGLPPELESQDWAAFSRAAATAHDLGMGVAAYVQPSNAAALGSYAGKDWYAVTPKGKRIPYYAGRFFTCLHHPQWRETVRARVAGALAAGADAIFLDNCAFGGMPIPLSRDYTAFAGCYCARCQLSFRDWLLARGMRAAGIPRLFRPRRDPLAREYAHWRAWTLTAFLRDLRDLMRGLNPRARMLTNTFGAVNLDTYHLFGVDLPELAHVVDWLFVENLQSPRAEAGALVQNAGTFKLMQALRPGAPALSISYNRGIGVDAVPPPRAVQRMLAEGHAAGGVPVLRGGEYIDRDTWTLLQPGRNDAQAGAARRISDFVRAYPELFEGRRSAATVAVYVPPGLGWRGDAPIGEGNDFLSVLQALVGAAVPFRVVAALAELGGVRLLLLPAGFQAPAGFRGAALPYEALGLQRGRRPFDLLTGPFEPLLRHLGPRIVDEYFTRVHVRRFVDRLNLVFRMVFRGQFASRRIAPRVVALLRAAQPCAVTASGPVYADLWETESARSLHLVNYGDAPVRASLTSALGPPDRVLTPAGESAGVTGGDVIVDTYTVLVWWRRGASQ